MRAPATTPAAARANLAGAEADRAYLKTAAADSFYAMAYYSHNLHFLADSHMMQGRLADARKAAAELAERLAPHADMMPMVESMAVMPVSVLLRFGQDAEVLALPQPAADRPVMTAWWHFARAQALARGGKIEEAAAERAALAADGGQGAGIGAVWRDRPRECENRPGARDDRDRRPPGVGAGRQAGGHPIVDRRGRRRRPPAVRRAARLVLPDP